jgi:Tol biopolymer transport system component
MQTLKTLVLLTLTDQNRQWFDSGSLSPHFGGRDKPQWSPDGSKIIFQVTRDDIGTEIYIKGH